MQGVYRAGARIDGVTTAKTLMYITTPSNAIIEILRATVTAIDDVTNEQLVVELNRIATLGTPTATTTVTPKPTEELTTAFGGTVKADVTASEPTYDSAGSEIAAYGANKLAGWEFVPLPEERPVIKPSDTVGLHMLEALGVATDLFVEIIFRVIG